MSLRTCAAFADKLGVWLTRVPTVLDLRGCITSPRGNSGFPQSGLGVAYTPQAAWEEVLHELSHLAWWHPRRGVEAIDDEGGMIAYEFHVVRALSGRRRALEYLRTDYVTGTAISAPMAGEEGWVTRDVEDLRTEGLLWDQEWWLEGLKDARYLGLLDDNNEPTWRRASWGDADGLEDVWRVLGEAASDPRRSARGHGLLDEL